MEKPIVAYVRNEGGSFAESRPDGMVPIPTGITAIRDPDLIRVLEGRAGITIIPASAFRQEILKVEGDEGTEKKTEKPSAPARSSGANKRSGGASRGRMEGR